MNDNIKWWERNMRSRYVMRGLGIILMFSLVGNMVQGRILRDKSEEIYKIKRVNYKMIDEDLEACARLLADAFDGAHDVKEVLKEVSFNMEKLRNDVDMFNRTSRVAIEEEAMGEITVGLENGLTMGDKYVPIGELVTGLSTREEKFLKKLYEDLLQIDYEIHSMGEQYEEGELAEIFNTCLASHEYENLIYSSAHDETCD